MNVLVTGGCGFIGSHLVDSLLAEKNKVSVIDNRHLYRNPSSKIIGKDIVSDKIDADFRGMETVFHLAADPMVNTSAEKPRESFEINAKGTLNVLEACRKNDVKRILFTSTSTVYGDAKKLPTPEDYPCEPISNYGASKLSGEAYVSSYCHSYGMKGTNLRLANIFGERSTHGVMYDFYNKLRENPNQLEILGDGKQEKSYLHVSDCVSAILLTCKKQKKEVDYFNVGSNSKTTVDGIASLMCRELGLSPEFKYTGGERGWVGDVPLMLLDCSKLRSLGWSDKISFEQGLKKYVAWMRKTL